MLRCRHVGICAAAEKENAGEISIFHPWLPASDFQSLVLNPENGVQGIIVGGGEAVLRCQAVLHGDDNSWELRSNIVTEVVENNGGGAEEYESPPCI